MTYTRWGSSSCPSYTGAQLVYAGRVGGTYYSTSGGGAEKLCLPNNPDYVPGTSGLLTVKGEITHAEYEFHSGPNTNVFNHDVPCAVCHVPTRGTVIMVPAKSLCLSSWTREYYGYLTAENDVHQRSSFLTSILPGTSTMTQTEILLAMVCLMLHMKMVEYYPYMGGNMCIHKACAVL